MTLDSDVLLTEWDPLMEMNSKGGISSKKQERENIEPNNIKPHFKNG
jgi:hypothetical protein